MVHFSLVKKFFGKITFKFTFEQQQIGFYISFLNVDLTNRMILFNAPCITEHVAKKTSRNTQGQGIKLTATVSSDLINICRNTLTE